MKLLKILSEIRVVPQNVLRLIHSWGILYKLEDDHRISTMIGKDDTEVSFDIPNHQRFLEFVDSLKSRNIPYEITKVSPDEEIVRVPMKYIVIVNKKFNEIKNIAKIPKITYGEEREGLYGPIGKMTIKGLGSFMAEPTYPDNGTYTIIKANIKPDNLDEIWNIIKMIGKPANWATRGDVYEIPNSFVTIV